MKLSEYARKVGISYRTAWSWYRAGKIRGYQMDTGTIIIEDEIATKPERVAVYTRVSSRENGDNLEAQAERLVHYCEAKGYQVYRVVKEVGSGVDDNRQKFLALLGDSTITRIVVEHKDAPRALGFVMWTCCYKCRGAVSKWSI